LDASELLRAHAKLAQLGRTKCVVRTAAQWTRAMEDANLVHLEHSVTVVVAIRLEHALPVLWEHSKTCTEQTNVRDARVAIRDSNVSGATAHMPESVSVAKLECSRTQLNGIHVPRVRNVLDH